MFLAYQRASRPYKKVVFEVVYFVFLTVFTFLYFWGRRHEALAFKYMTLGQNCPCCSKMAITRRRSNLFPKFWKIPEAQDLHHSVSVSKHDLKPSGTFVLKMCMRPWLRRLPILSQEGDLRDVIWLNASTALRYTRHILHARKYDTYLCFLHISELLGLIKV